jgi:hypothetical protein
MFFPAYSSVSRVPLRRNGIAHKVFLGKASSKFHSNGALSLSLAGEIRGSISSFRFLPSRKYLP